MREDLAKEIFQLSVEWRREMAAKQEPKEGQAQREGGEVLNADSDEGI